MAKKNIADKYWIYGEDAELAARLTSYLTRVVYNQRANYIRALMKIKEHECSIEDCDSDIESQSMRSGNSLEVGLQFCVHLVERSIEGNPQLLFIHSDTSETSSCPDISCGSSSSRSDARLRFSIRFAITRSYRGASRPPMRS